MRAIIQRVSEASVTVDGNRKGAIQGRMLVLLGIEQEDTAEDTAWLAKKIVQLRIFSDEAGQMNRSLKDTGGDILLISQFTLFAQTKKGNRPSFIRAARPEAAIPLYDSMIVALGQELGRRPQTGIFGADMKVYLINEGPVTIYIDSKNKE